MWLIFWGLKDIDAVKNNDEVIKFLSNCGNENLQSLLVPSRLEHALNCLDTDSDGEITAPEWEAAIEQALRAKIEQRRAAREAQAAADRRELEAFKEQFLNAAREVFALIDADGNGSLTKTEIVDAVTSDKKVISFLGSCGEPNLQFLLQPKRLEKALKVLDTSQDGEIDADEWCVFRVRKIRVASTAWSWCRAHPDAIAATAHRSLHRAGRSQSSAGSRSASSSSRRRARGASRPPPPRTPPSRRRS